MKILYIFFRRKKIYCVEWHSVYNIYRRDYVKARDKAHAWKIVQKKRVIADYCDKIYEIE